MSHSTKHRLLLLAAAVIAACGGGNSSPGVGGGDSDAGSPPSDAAGDGPGTDTSTSSGGLPPGDFYTLPADRTTTWQPGVTYNGGIPARTTIYKTLTPSGGDDTSSIQAALDTCPPEQVVMLGPGTFHVSGSGLAIKTSKITLRGSGPSSTIIAGTPSSAVVIIGTRFYKWGQQTDLVADVAKETDTLTLKSNPGLKVGEIVHVDETYDSSITYYNPDKQNGDFQGWGEGRKGPQADSRPIGQSMEIKSITGNTLTFTTKFHTAFRTAHAAHVARITDGQNVVQPVVWSGIEDLAVTGGGGGDGGGNIRLFAVAYCWGKHLESSLSNGASFAFDGAFRSEVRDSYLHTSADPNPGGGGYSLIFDRYTADSLAENNISWNFNKVSVMRSTGGGNVVAYNYFEDAYGSGYPTIPEVGMNGSHMAGSHYELFEGNQAFNFDSDSYWGSQMYYTVFRNHLTTLRRSIRPGTADGVKVKLTDEVNRRGIGLTIHQRWHNFVGNVIGYPDGYLQNPKIGFAYPAAFSPAPQGKTFQYEWLGGPFGSDGQFTPMWQLGYEGQTWPKTQDTEVQATTLRDANYDYGTKSVRWHGIGGTGAGAPASPKPLRPSLYLAGKPAFFGANPWPWVDGATGANPLPGILPARTRFDNGTPNDL